MDEGNSVMAQANVQNSTPTSQVDNKSVNNQTDTTEKSIKPGMENNDTQQAQAESVREQMVPKSRMDDYRVKAEAYEKELSELRSKAQILDRLEGAFKPQVQEDPVRAEADSALREMGYVRGEDVQNMVQQLLDQREMVREFGSKMETLSKQYSGEKGEPKFVAEEIAKYMDDFGVKDPEKAYKLMHEEALADLKVKSKLAPTYTERAGTPANTQSDGKKEELDALRRGEVSFTDVLLNRLKK